MRRWWKILPLLIAVGVGIIETGWLQSYFLYKYRFFWFISIILLATFLAYYVQETLNKESQIENLKGQIVEDKQTILSLESQKNQMLGSQDINVLLDTNPTQNGFDVVVLFELPHRMLGYFQTTKLIIIVPDFVCVTPSIQSSFISGPQTTDNGFSTYVYKPSEDRLTYQFSFSVTKELTGMVKITTRLQIDGKTRELLGQSSLEQTGCPT